MCGVIGFIGANAINKIVSGLETLEYRGYDSSGVGIVNNNKIEIIKTVGSIDKLKEKINFKKYSNANIGIGHTRWATHGAILDKNAHPFESNNLILIHNGIIENHKELKDFLTNKGYEFKSDVDSEVALNLIDYYYKNNNYLNAIESSMKKLKGSYSFLIIFKDNLETIYGVKKDSPLYVSINEKELILSSDLIATAWINNQYYNLFDNEIVECTSTSIKIYNHKLELVNRDVQSCNLTKDHVSKQSYKHYMLKEIYQEEEIFKLAKDKDISYLSELVKDLEEIVIVGCGSAMHAGMIGKYLFSTLTKIKTSVEIASEFRYSPFLYNTKALFIFISQSGETADTIAALRLAKQYKVKTLGIVNVLGSTIANECDYLLNLNVGSEIAVASTKAYYGQILYLYKLCFLIAKEKKINLAKIEKEFLKFKLQLGLDNSYLKKIAKKISKYKNIFFIGRGVDYCLACEGSLKLKEITYIHSEAYQGGELKHGPISLINSKSLVIAISSAPNLKAKINSNIEEIISRKGKVILISEEIYNKDKIINIKFDKLTNNCLSPLVIIPILQFLAYYCAIYKKTNIDKPKNLAKSVTVE